MKCLVLLALMLFPALAQAQWDNTDKALLATSTVLLVVDWGQTRYIARNPDRFHETNPILGKHPSVGRVNTYFGAALIGNYLLADWLGPTNRKIWLGSMTALEAGVVIYNKGLGIKVDF